MQGKTAGMGALLRFLVLFWIAGFPSVKAGELHIAVAANFVKVLGILKPHFEKQSGHQLLISSGSTGKMAAQVQSQAPYEVFLSADEETVEKLIQGGHAWADSKAQYALGRLVVWGPHLPTTLDLIPFLKGENFRHVAVANPKLAPYGRAAQECLKKWGVYAEVETRQVLGESIAQVDQFLASGNAELGFLAASQMVDASPSRKTGFRFLVPSDCHAPLSQFAVILKRAKGEKLEIAKKFMAFLTLKSTQELIQNRGYGPSFNLVALEPQ